MTWAELRRLLVDRGLVRGEASGTGAGEPAAAPVTGIAHDSRRVAPGEVFVALRGEHADGAGFARQAAARGAAAVVAEQPAPAGLATPWIVVDDARVALALLAAAFQRQPSRE